MRFKTIASKQTHTHGEAAGAVAMATPCHVLQWQRVPSEGRGPRPSSATRSERRTRAAAAPKKTKEQRAAHKPATQSTNRESKRELEKKRQKSKKRNEKRHTNESTSFSTKDTETRSTNCTGCERRTKEKRGTFFWDWIGPCYLMGTDADCFVNELVSIWYFCVWKFWKSCRVGLRIVFSFSFYHWRIFCFLKL